MSWSILLAVALNWPVRYNDGVKAYRSNDFSSAASAFEQATAAPDKTIQQRAYYNLGDAQYRLGEAHWERAVKSYESALALDPKDGDAKFNRDFVKKKLEELKKQQEQQQQQQEQQQQQQKQQQQQQKQQNQQNQEQQKNEQDQKQDQEQQQQQQKSPQESGKEQPPKQEPQQSQRQEPQAGDLDKQQAKALLDNLRENERNWNFFPELQMKDADTSEPAKDW